MDLCWRIILYHLLILGLIETQENLVSGNNKKTVCEKIDFNELPKIKCGREKVLNDKAYSNNTI